MNKLASCGLAVLLCASPVLAQVTAPGAETGRPAVRINNEVTVTGCVMTESDYQTLRNGGGMLGSRLGAGDLVLANAIPSAGGRGARRGGDRVEARPIEDDSPIRPGSRNFTLDGPLEKALLANMWRLTRIVGTAEGTAASKPDGSVDELPRMTVTSWEDAGEVCLR